jgi:Tol biopolymer transport system component
MNVTTRTLAACALAIIPCALTAQQREGVLKQINEPHPYYYHEMYLPQVTTGPSSVTWSPDGKEVIFAMNGSLWRQTLGTNVAHQITWGQGYDHQPDWSPNGKEVAFVRYENDAMELEVLDLATGVSTPLTLGGAVNVEPRWSPDGTRIAFVTTQFEGRFNVAVADLTTGLVKRVTPQHDSHLPRYYYSVFDQYLSPTWSADGNDLIIVSNRGHIWGAGTLWRLPIAHPDSMREIHDEETSWRARPDWARDGRRVVYSSYVGRQRNGLWLTTGDGGHPLELTYGDYDATNPRWSPDGSAIAYISNEGGNTSLWTVALPGGQRARVRQDSLAYREKMAMLSVRIASAAGTEGAAADARVAVMTTDGRSWAPRDALRHADDSFDRKERPYEVAYFHARGTVLVPVPAGAIRITVTKGLEYAVETRTITLAPAERRAVVIVPRRLVNLPALGWYSADLHVHMNYGGHYVVTPKELALQARAEDVHVIENLIVNKEQRFPDIAWFTGKPDAASTATNLIVSGQEYHTSYWGHAGLLGITDHIQLPGYAAYQGTAVASLVPTNLTVMTLARAQHGVTGYVHPFDDPVDPADTATPLHNELPVDVALGVVDYMEILGFSDHRNTAAVWYKLLNCGFRIPAGAGTDAMTNYASLRGPVGLNRVYVKAGPVLTHAAFLAALKAGKTFATNGPLLELTVNGRDIGSDIDVPSGTSKLTVTGRMRSIVAVDKVEIVVNGNVVDSLPLSADHMSAQGTRTITVSASSWVTLRAWSAHSQAPILDIYPFATTSPVYITVGGRPQRSAKDTQFFMAWLARLGAAADANTDYNSPAEKAEVLRAIMNARAEYTKRLEEAVEFNAQ